MVDVVLLLACLAFAVSGYWQGFLVGALSFLGFFGAAVVGIALAPTAVRARWLDGVPDPVVALGLIVALALLGQVVATVVGSALRQRLTWRPARQLDAAGGAVISVVALLLFAWVVGDAVKSSQLTGIASQVRQSQVLSAVDRLVPRAGKELNASLRRAVGVTGFPEVFGGFTSPRVADVPPPDPAVTRSRAVQVARSRVLKVTGVARSCASKVEGTGFVYAPERVMTNAHVIAGVREPDVEVNGRKLPAKVVQFDPRRDVAVLAVPGLDLKPLDFAPDAEQGASAVVVGYPNDGPFRADAARIRGTQRARGTDIYQRGRVEREIYVLRGLVQPGNSGGPLLAPNGDVYGVIFAAAADQKQVGYALTADEVAGVARAGATATEPVSTGDCD